MSTKKVTKADKIWEDIKSLQIKIYALPNQRVADHVERLKGPTSEVFLKLRASAVLTSLETALLSHKAIKAAKTAGGRSVKTSCPKYDMEEAEGYVIVKDHVPASDDGASPLGPRVITGKEE